MENIKIGIIREGKQPPDQRVAFLPQQIADLIKKHPELNFYVQSSAVRCVPDEAYSAYNIPMVDDLNSCDILFGIKEVPIDQLMEGKVYFFFSHTIKKQAYNKKLLQSILDKNITLIDYECLTDEKGNRLVAFGRYAGLVGAYNALWVWGKRTGLYQLKRAYASQNLLEMFENVSQLSISNIKIAVTGGGRVSNGAMEMLDTAGIKKVSVEDYLHHDFHEPVYAQLRSQDYYKHKNGNWDSQEFYQNPNAYKSNFSAFTEVTDILIHAAYWDNRADILFSTDQMKDSSFKIKVIADITCDIKGSIPSTLRASTILDPVYDYDPKSELERPAFSNENHIQVMAIDNLPTEVPYDASEEFGNMLGQHVIPHLKSRAQSDIIQRAIITHKGHLTQRFQYLEDFVSTTV